MVLRMIMTKVNTYISIFFILLFLFFDFGIYAIPPLLFYLLTINLSVLPSLTAWFNKSSYGELIKLNICYIFFSIFVYSILYYKNGLIVNGEFKEIDLLTAIYFSGTTWTTIGYGEIVAPSEIRLLTTIEAINSYFAMAILMSLIILWLDYQIKVSLEYTSNIRKKTKTKKSMIKDIKYFREYYNKKKTKIRNLEKYQRQ